MKKTTTKKNTTINYDKYIVRVSKLACGQSVNIPKYGIVRAYKNKNGDRRFALSGTCDIGLPRGGNLLIKTIINDIRFVQTFSTKG